MAWKKQDTVLVVLVVFTIALRFFLSMQTDTLEPEAYFLTRQVEHVKEHFIPDYNDDLSFGGRTYFFPPLWVYLITLFSYLFATITALKLVSALLAGVLVLVVYVVTKDLSNKNLALLASGATILLPIYLDITLLTGSVHLLILPLTLYYFKAFVKQYKSLTVLTVLLVLLHPSSYLLVIALLVFLALQKTNHQKLNDAHKEYALFFLFLASWFYAILYKQAFLINGARAIWQNLPVTLLDQQFGALGFTQAIAVIGIVPLLLGIIGANRALKSNQQLPLLTLAYALTIAALLFFRLMNLELGLMYLGVLLIILSTVALRFIKTYLAKTRFQTLYTPFVTFIILLFVLTTTVPFLNGVIQPLNRAYPAEYVEALTWLDEKSTSNQVTLAALEHGHAITYYAKTKNVLDENFLSQADARTRYEVVQNFFEKQNAIEAGRTLQKYGVDYIFLTPKDPTPTILEADCMILLYDEEVKIYRNNCEVTS